MRKLLRRLRHPQSLERDDLALGLKRAYNVATAKEALATFVTNALSSYDPALRKIIERCDINGEPTKQVAGELGLSMRQFFRYRGRAIEAIAIALEDAARSLPEAVEPGSLLMRMVVEYDARVALDILATARTVPTGREILGLLAGRLAAGERLTLSETERLPPELRAPASVMVARSAECYGDVEEAEELVDRLAASVRDDATRFDLAGLACQQAIRRGDPAALVAWARRSRAIANGDAARSAAADLRLAEAVLRYGTLAAEFGDPLKDALRSLPFSVAAARTAARLKAYRAFLAGERTLAYESARTAALAGFEPFDTVDARILTARAAYLLGLPRPEAPVVANADWHAGMSAAVDARFALRRRERAEARSLAQSAVRHAERARSPGTLAYAKATLGAVASSEGNGAEAQRWFVDAWRLVTLHPDDTILFDLFAIQGLEERDLGPIVFDETFLRSFAEMSSDGVRAEATAGDLMRLRERLHDELASKRAAGGAGFAALARSLRAQNVQRSA